MPFPANPTLNQEYTNTNGVVYVCTKAPPRPAWAVKNLLTNQVDTLRTYDTIAVAAATNIPGSAQYVLIGGYLPQPRLFKRSATDPGSGDRFQSADGAYWIGTALPPSIIDLPNEVARTSDVAFGVDDMDKAHAFSIGAGVTVGATLPPAVNFLGRILHISVESTASGKLQLRATPGNSTSLIEDWPTNDFYMWAGEDIVLKAAPLGWRIRGGRCRPIQLTVTRPAASGNVTMTDANEVAFDSWEAPSLVGSQWRHSLHALNSSAQVVIPRRGYYSIEFSTLAQFAGTTPTICFGAIQSFGALTTSRLWSPLIAGNPNTTVRGLYNGIFATGDPVKGSAYRSGGSATDALASFTRLTLTESPRW
jgi:hypothetical protein